MLKRFLPVIIIIAVVGVFFRSFFLHGLLPIPSDVMVGLYHPFRDFYAKEYSRGVPFKNVLLADPTSQQYPWRNFAMLQLKQSQLPVWNPYTALGMPLLANQQSGVFYPLNILFFFMPFSLGWSFLILSSLILGGLFMYYYLRNLSLDPRASLLGSITFIFSGFFVAWLEWGNIPHVILWTPLLLLSIDKMNESDIFKNIRDQQKHTLLWSAVFIFALSASFFAGHVQSFFYVFIMVLAYWIARMLHYKRHRVRRLVIFIFSLALFACITWIQWYPTLQLIDLSARNLNGNMWQKDGWFIPLEHFAQFIAPDFFGNPATLNYWGVWNYGEFIGYIGIVPLLFVFFSILFRHDWKTRFFTILGFGALLLALPFAISQAPFILKIPFISTAQPTRLLLIVDVSFAVLTALGCDYYLRVRKKIYYPLAIIGGAYLFLWLSTLILTKANTAFFGGHVSVARHNLVFPGIIIILTGAICFLVQRFPKKQMLVYLFMLLAAGDLLRFATKYDSFVSPQFLYPSTKSLTYLQQHAGFSRILFTDKRILTPNIPVMYQLQTIEGYDPLLPRDYIDFTSAMGRNKPDISPIEGFNRIVTPHEYNSPLTQLMNIGYVVSLDELHEPSLTKVFEEGETKIYRNNIVSPRTFFVQNVKVKSNKQDSIHALFAKDTDVHGTAFVQSQDALPSEFYAPGKATILSYSPNSVQIQTENTGQGFLVLTDAYYPTWQVFIDGKETTIYKTDFMFRGVVVPTGKHLVVFSDKLF